MQLVGIPGAVGEDSVAEQSRLARASRSGRDGVVRRLLAAGDLLAVGAAAALALGLPLPRNRHEVAWALFVLPLMLVMFKLYGLYERDAKRISYSTVDDLPALFHAIAVGTLGLWLYSRFTPLGKLDLVELLLFAGSLLLIAAGLRALVRSASARLLVRERALFVGGDEMIDRFAARLGRQPLQSLSVLGVLAPESAPGSTAADLPLLGTLGDLEDVAVGFGVTRVVLSRDLPPAELEQLLRDCRRLSLKVSLLPRLADVLGRGVEVEDVQGLTVLGVNPPWLPRSSRAIKRGMDLVVAGLALLLASPLLLAIAAAVKLTSRGPVLFRQERIGRSGRRFRIVKFRTMVADAELRHAQLLVESRDPDWLLLDKDPRITSVGGILRRLSLDELPQLWNVLRGEMSLVGPRPLVPSEDERVTGWVRGRLDLTPGITGYWQVLGRTRIPFEEMVKLDYLYVMSWSLWEDVRLLLKTLPVALSGRGAN